MKKTQTHQTVKEFLANGGEIQQIPRGQGVIHTLKPSKHISLGKRSRECQLEKK